MAAKKRVYDLAKEYGMTGQELAAKLRDLGFTQVKSHMTALSEFDVLEIQARLEAYGIVGESDGEGLGTMGGLKIKRKKKKVAPAEEVAETEEPAVEAAPPDEGAPAAEVDVEPAPPEEVAPPEATPIEAVPAAEAAPVVEGEAAAEITAETAAPVEAPVEPIAATAPVEPPAEVAPAETPPPEAVAPAETAPVEATPRETGIETPAAEGAAPEADAPAEEPTAAEATPETVTPAAEAPAETAPPAEPAAEVAVEPAPGAAIPTAAIPTAAIPTAKAPAEESATEVAPAAAKLETPAAPEPPPADGAKPVAGKGAGKEVKPEGAAPAKKSPDKTVVRPSATRRPGKVVGFIDPSQFQQQPARRSQSRRLRSKDDTVPDVRPTLGRDRRSGQVRGDVTRGSLTAQQLRERESGRFLRRRRPQRGGTGGRGGRRDHAATAGSTHAGSVVEIEAPVTVKKLANTLGVKENQVLKAAFGLLGWGININTLLDEDSAIVLAQEFDVELAVIQEVAKEEALLQELSAKREAVNKKDLTKRSPTVAFLGHVDHGKTTLIDSIRESRITSGESGGITQHIGAYQVTTAQGNLVTIIDTPGHAAFTSMRARGANAVDVVVLVVAADDGVKPQTEEALNHARAAGTPIVVALNKMDKPEANPERVMGELAALGLNPEEWGGDTDMLRVSALKGEGVEELLERVFLESEVLELTADPAGPAEGVVLEAEIQKGKGKVAHLLVQDGTLHRGDFILAGAGYGKVRAIHDDRGKQINEALPAMPVEVTGLNELPTVGDRFHVVESLDRAQDVAQERARQNRQVHQAEQRRTLHHDIFAAVAEQEKPTINLIVKADVQGSVEVLRHQIGELVHDEMQVRLLHSGVGSVLESDVDLAATSDARILAFHTSAETKVRQNAERQGVDIKVYEVIYELLDDVRRLMEGELAPEIREEITGHAEIRRVFKSSKFGNIAGSYVLDGKIARSNKIRLLRDGQVVHTGTFASVRRESDDTKEVREGFECGLLIKDYNDIREGDVVETFKHVEYKRTL